MGSSQRENPVALDLSSPVMEPAPDPGSLIAELEQAVLTEQSARQALQAQITVLTARIENVSKQVSLLSRPGAGAAPGSAARAGDAATMSAAGFDPGRAQELAQRWGERNMGLLYLRDQASREGWLDSPRFREERTALDEDYVFEDQLSAQDFDRFLFATGQSNRIVVQAVIEGSPAQIFGVVSGDLILSYDQIPIRSGSDLRGAINFGEVDQPVIVEVQRGDEVIPIEMPRGPLGIHLDGLSVLPR